MTEPRDSEWRERFRASMPAEPADACPSPETLWSAARGDLAPEELDSLSGHLRTCAACGEALAISAELAHETQPRLDARSPPRFGRVAAVATGITALAAGLVIFLAQPEPVPSGSRGNEPTTPRGEVGGVGIRSLSKEEQPASEARRQWTPVEHAVRYRLQVSTEDLRPVYDRTLEGTVVALPPAVGHLALRGGATGGGGASPLLWQVEAMLPDGRSVTSPTFRVRLLR
jgi:hypothetical protein